MDKFRRYEFKEHTADVLVVARGRTLEELFENSGLALFEIMTDTSKVSPIVKVKVEDKGFDLENLLYKWLEDLLYYYDSQNLVFSKFKVKSINRYGDDYVISGEAFGEEFDPQKHEPRTIVKAITYANMKILKKDDLWEATFVVDI